MFKKVTTSLILILLSSFGFSQTTDLLISEYIEGSSNNKYIEIYNGTGANVNLNDYDIRIYFNGSATVGNTINLSGTLATGNVYIIAHSSAVAWGGSPDLITGSLTFNGDDAVELYNSVTASMVDLVGNIGCDPGTQWSSGGNNTQDNTIVRNANICSGVTSDDPTVCPFPLLATDWTQFAQDDVSNLGFHNETCGAPCVPAAQPTTNSSSLNFSNVTCYTIDLSWTAGNGANRIVVASTSPIVGTPTDQTLYTANANFGAGSTIAAGEFVVYNGAGSSFTVSSLTTNTTYYFAIFEYNGGIANCEENYFVTGVLTGNQLTATCSCPEITGILVDACGGAIEGINEFFTFENGNSSLPIDSLIASFPNGGSFCNSGCGTQTWTTNPAFVNTLNTTAACPGLFVEVDPIPAGGKVVVFTGASPTYNFDFSGLCGTGPYYAIFANNTNTAGRFANYSATCSVRTLTVDFGNSCSDDASYDRCLLNGSPHDGDYVSYDPPGNPTYMNDGCTPQAILPIILVDFKGEHLDNGSNLLEWATSSEINNNYFSVEYSGNAIDFNLLGTIPGAGNSNTLLYYDFIDDHPQFGITYYRLKQTDFNGNFEYSPIIAINNSKESFTIFVTNNTLNFSSVNADFKGEIEIYDISGRKVLESMLNNNSNITLNGLNKGIYVYQVKHAEKITSDKFIVR